MDEIKHLRFGTSWNEEHFDGELAFRNMQAEFGAAAAKHPAEVHESFYIFGGRSVRIRVVGRALAEHICRPFSHLRTNGQIPATPQLAIDFWDDATNRDRLI